VSIVSDRLESLPPELKALAQEIFRLPANLQRDMMEFHVILMAEAYALAKRPGAAALLHATMALVLGGEQVAPDSDLQRLATELATGALRKIDLLKEEP
jgi:hypothetical protein